MTIELTNEDVNVLIEAIQAWEKEPSTEGTMRSMFSSLFEACDPSLASMSREEKQDRLERTRRKEKDEIDAMVALRRDTSILLQAKLIAARSKHE